VTEGVTNVEVTVWFGTDSPVNRVSLGNVKLPVRVPPDSFKYLASAVLTFNELVLFVVVRSTTFIFDELN
jgi:hypothetical protein